MSNDLALINKLSRATLTEDEVYTFLVRLCDNEVDRDGERFDDETLDALSEMFVGKTGIFDHDWSSKNQTARIYKTEVITDADTKTSAGLPSRWLKGYAYMLKDGNAALIAEIEAGIKREVSVGCSVAERRCSVCGATDGACGHERGKSYGGAVCHTVLHGARDAYEWSFVAVPSQTRSGVTKYYGKGGNEMAETKNISAEEYESLTKDAQFGREMAGALRSEAARLCVAALGLDDGIAKSLSAALAPGELGGFNAALKRLAPPATPQTRTSHAVMDGAFEPYTV